MTDFEKMRSLFAAFGIPYRITRDPAGTCDILIEAGGKIKGYTGLYVAFTFDGYDREFIHASIWE